MSWLLDLMKRLLGQSPSGPAEFGANLAKDLLAAHNRERAAESMPPFRQEVRLQREAAAHAAYMAEKGTLAHFGIGDGDPGSRLIALGYRYASASENAAAGQSSVAQVMGDWMNSPGHRANVLGRYSDFGGAVRRSQDGVSYWCAVFAVPGLAPSSPMPAAAPAPSAPQDGLVPPWVHS